MTILNRLSIQFYLFSGKIDLEELIKAFQELGVEMEREEAKKLLARFVEFIDSKIFKKLTFYDYKNSL